MTTEKARQHKLEWYRRNYQAVQADPVRREKLRAQKEAARARRRAKLRSNVASKLPATINAALYRAHGPWAPLFVLQAAA
jgi:hypothetical protein